MSLKITAVRNNYNNELSKAQLSDGRTVTRKEIIHMIGDGELKGYAVVARDDTVFIRSNPDGDMSNNLSNLPNF